jgi:5-methylthioadenosine/S-adenosylhomocysteine deaminase
MKKWALEVDTLITPDKEVEKKTVVINNGYIEEIIPIRSNNSKITLQIEDAVLSPGLINSHDHLLGTYYPKVGNGPYENWLPWDNDLKSAEVYNERQQIQNRDLYLLGGYRNLVSGVTSVQDHIPHFVQEPYLDLLPTKVISDYALAHSITSFALNWGDGIENEYKKAEAEGIPFITHIAEGFDSETIRDLDTLIKKNGLGPNSVLIHGIAFDDHDIERIAKAGASVVWCGDSNMFMFDKTAQIKPMLDAGVNVCIGTDSPMSGGLNLLEELRYDRKIYPELFGG